MTIDKLSLLNVFSLTCGFGKKLYYKNLLRRLTEIEENFSKPTVRFRTNVWDLYDCLVRASKIPLEEDLDLFRYTELTISTKSSEKALEYMEVLLRGEASFKKEDYFKEVDYSKPKNIIEWYSNIYSFQKFYDDAITIVGLWCLTNPKYEEGVSKYDTTSNSVNRVLLEFLSSRDFKMIITDLINISRFNLEKNLGLLNG